MICTEEEAKKKWCPMARSAEGIRSRSDGQVYVQSNNSYNCVTVSEGKELETYHQTVCIASDCMMWRREKDTYGDDYGKDIPEDRGYCGLGGMP